MIPISYAQYLVQLRYNLVDPCDTNLKQKFFSNLWIKDIVVSDVKIRLGVFFPNWDFISPPQIYLFEDDLIEINKKAPHFKFPLPHFSIGSQFTYKDKKAYSFCYALHDKVEINRKSFSQIILFLESQFYNVLLKLINPFSFKQELEQELVPMWMILSNDFEKKFSLNSLFVKLNNNWGLHKVSLTYSSTGKDSIQKTIDCNFIIIKISKLKFPSLSKYFDENGGVTLGRMLLFINDLDPNYFKLLKQYLTCLNSSKKIFISLLFDNHVFSFYVDWKKVYFKSLGGNINIFSKILNEAVFPVYIKNYCIRELVNRNLKDIKLENLTDLKILQIGAGAIGGYIADALVKIGAGVGEGCLKICDYDDLKIENMGRHILGQKYIGLNKASAIVLYINEQVGSPYNFNVDVICTSVNTVENIDEYDLIVDATGQIEIAEYLNEKIVAVPVEKRPNLLHLWIYGNGECVQALMNQPFMYDVDGGCISCLHQSGVDDYNYSLDPLRNIEFKKIMGLGPCAAYTPYAISSSLAVAGLAVDILLEWRNSTPLKNNYFTRYSIGYEGEKIEDMSLKAQSTCPHCNDKSRVEIVDVKI